ncbi:MAG: putative beta-lysine N-acetyltransferase [Candidatus Saccharimonadaceae bacterium]|nr:putative beta-lysine N-acetyltransferase [Candidatus Saccharimonadaceae bacterium]
MTDEIIKYHNSVIQHGKVNDRVYLMKLGNSPIPEVIGKIEQLAANNLYSKIFIKVPEAAKEFFQKSGYDIEAEIPGFYNGVKTAFFMGKFFDSKRKKDIFEDKIKDILNLSISKAEEKTLPPSGQVPFLLRTIRSGESEIVAELFRKVFETYPFPIHDAAYIKEMMKEQVEYCGAWDGKQLAALSAGEMDFPDKNVEMTDFATLPQYRGRSTASLLLAIMEKRMKEKAFKTAYTIARSLSCGMNITFARAGYKFGGTLINNTNICGKIESMNVWYKPL